MNYCASKTPSGRVVRQDARRPHKSSLLFAPTSPDPAVVAVKDESIERLTMSEANPDTSAARH